LFSQEIENDTRAMDFLCIGKDRIQLLCAQVSLSAPFTSMLAYSVQFPLLILRVLGADILDNNQFKLKMQVFVKKALN